MSNWEREMEREEANLKDHFNDDISKLVEETGIPPTTKDKHYT